MSDSSTIPRVIRDQVEYLDASTTESIENAKIRLTIELEFVECLCNPLYLHSLALRGYFEDDAFIAYLKYLRYFTESEYALLLKYPQSLFYLKRLQDEKFRQALKNPEYAHFLQNQQHDHWIALGKSLTTPT